MSAEEAVIVRTQTKPGEGAPEVRIFADRVELGGGGTSAVIHYWDIARWPWPGWLWRTLWRLRLTRREGMVGEREWNGRGGGRVTFYDRSSTTIHFPDDPDTPSEPSAFRRAQRVMRRGGFATDDLR